jgi:hypothetical protein
MRRVRLNIDSSGELARQLEGASISHDDVCSYLKSHPVVLSARGQLPDRICASGTPIPIAFYTDGEWIWSDELAEYVCRYDLGLPDEFLAGIADNGARIKDVSTDQQQEASDVLRAPRLPAPA